MKRREFLKLSFAAAALTAPLRRARALADIREISLGYQKSGVLVIARQQAALEKHFAAKGIAVKSRFRQKPRAGSAANHRCDGSTANWAEAHRDDVAKSLSPVTGIPLETEIVAANRSSFAVGPITEDIVATEQGVADRFFKLGLIPKQVAVRDALWKPEQS